MRSLLLCALKSWELSGQGHTFVSVRALSYSQLFTTSIFALQCHHGLWTRSEMLILWRVRMLNLPVLSKEHRGLRSGQFLKRLGNKSHIPILYGLKTLLAFFSQVMTLSSLSFSPYYHPHAGSSLSHPSLVSQYFFFLARIWNNTYR